MVAISLISKWKKLKQYFKCEFKEGHEWKVILSVIDNHQTFYDTLFECRKCGKRIWKKTCDRLPIGYIIKEIQ